MKLHDDIIGHPRHVALFSLSGDRQKGVTNSHFDIELDHFASKPTTPSDIPDMLMTEVDAFNLSVERQRGLTTNHCIYS